MTQPVDSCVYAFMYYVHRYHGRLVDDSYSCVAFVCERYCVYCVHSVSCEHGVLKENEIGSSRLREIDATCSAVFSWKMDVISFFRRAMLHCWSANI